jgi:hypothetical protein
MICDDLIDVESNPTSDVRLIHLQTSKSLWNSKFMINENYWTAITEMSMRILKLKICCCYNVNEKGCMFNYCEKRLNVNVENEETRETSNLRNKKRCENENLK